MIASLATIITLRNMQPKKLGITSVTSLKNGTQKDIYRMSEQYRIENFSNPCPFTIVVEHDPDIALYSVRVNILGKWYTRDIGSDRHGTGRLDAIILAKETARALEDAFRMMYEDNS